MSRPWAHVRFVLSLLVVLTLAFMPVSMVHQMASARVTAAMQDTGALAMDHCAGRDETKPVQHHDTTQGCAMACAVVQPMTPQVAAQSGPVQAILSPRPSPRLDGIAPNAASPPPRLLPKV